jgi:hypothetical protein
VERRRARAAGDPEAASYADLSRAAFDRVLDMLSGAFPSDELAELRPRLDLGPRDRPTC